VRRLSIDFKTQVGMVVAIKSMIINMIIVDKVVGFMGKCRIDRWCRRRSAVTLNHRPRTRSFGVNLHHGFGQYRSLLCRQKIISETKCQRSTSSFDRFSDTVERPLAHLDRNTVKSNQSSSKLGPLVGSRVVKTFESAYKNNIFRKSQRTNFFPLPRVPSVG